LKYLEQEIRKGQVGDAKI
jgi:hypothetical protein